MMWEEPCKSWNKVPHHDEDYSFGEFSKHKEILLRKIDTRLVKYAEESRRDLGVTAPDSQTKPVRVGLNTMSGKSAHREIMKCDR